jgi:polyhydroxyalkanoate synthase
VGESTASLDATPNAFGRASFATMDILRRALGSALGAFGLDPDECPHRIVDFGPHWRLRDYGGHKRSSSLLVVATPIKRAYIWDLAPSVSAVRYCMQAGLHVHLLEWLPASDRNQNNGLDEYTEAISECVARISGGAPGATPFLVGHSLGGTLAAIFTAWAPASIRGLSYSSEHRFALSRQRVDSGTPSSRWFRRRSPMATLFQGRYYRSSPP